MKITAIYDNGGRTLDRYSIFTNVSEGKYRECLSLSDDPTAYNGMSQFSVGVPGKHLGRLIGFVDLPENVQEHAAHRIFVEEDTSVPA